MHEIVLTVTFLIIQLILNEIKKILNKKKGFYIIIQINKQEYWILNQIQSKYSNVYYILGNGILILDIVLDIVEGKTPLIFSMSLVDFPIFIFGSEVLCVLICSPNEE